MWFLPGGSMLIPLRRAPGEAGSSPRTLTHPEQATKSRNPEYGATCPQRDEHGSSDPPRLLGEGLLCQGPTWWPRPPSGRHAPRTTLLFALSEDAQILRRL